MVFGGCRSQIDGYCSQIHRKSLNLWVLKVVYVMFRGEYYHNIDAKGRVIVPVKLRNALGESFYISKEIGGCLSIYTPDKWEALEEKLNTLPTTDPKALALRRFKLSSALECEPDANGRIMIPQNLREYAGLKKEIVTIGNGDRVEIWDKDSLDAYYNEYDFKNANDFADLTSYGI